MTSWFCGIFHGKEWCWTYRLQTLHHGRTEWHGASWWNQSLIVGVGRHELSTIRVDHWSIVMSFDMNISSIVLGSLEMQEGAWSSVEARRKDGVLNHHQNFLTLDLFYHSGKCRIAESHQMYRYNSYLNFLGSDIESLYICRRKYSIPFYDLYIYICLYF